MTEVVAVTTLSDPGAATVADPADAQRPLRNHEPALDGLRALAVTGVLLYHAGYLHGGFLGVDAFFVLSGFLITTLLLREIERTGSVGFRGFWARRAKRLLPALGGVLLGVVLYAWLFADPQQLSSIRGNGLATIFYVANWRDIAVRQDYFSLFGAPSPLQHMWSLAIEEQFYLVWPLLLAALSFRRAGFAARRVLAVSLVLATASWAWTQWLYDPRDPSRVYFGTDTRATSILVGAALAALVAWRGTVEGRHRRLALEAVAVLCAIGLAIAWTRFSGGSTLLYRCGLLGCAVGVAVVVAAACHPRRGPLFVLLAWTPLRQVGVISYGLYLWHWPVFVFLDEARTGMHGLVLLALRFAITLAVAVCSFYAIERPVRYGTIRTAQFARVAPIVAGVLAIALVASTATRASSDDGPGLSSIPDVHGPVWRNALADFRHGALQAPKNERVLVLGDSIPLTLRRGRRTGYFRTNGMLGVSAGFIFCSIVGGDIVTAGHTEKSDPRCRDWPQYFATAVDAFDPSTVVLMLGPWEMFDRTIGGTRIDAGTAGATRRLLAALDRIEPQLTAHGARLVVLTTPCFEPREVQLPGAANVLRDETRRAWVNGVWQSFARAHRGVSIARLDALLCPGGRALTKVDGNTIRSDGLHFTAAGATFVWRWLASVVAPGAADSAAADPPRASVAP